MAERVKPYFCGGFSACFASLVVHPIDLIKVRLQILPPGSGIVSVGQKILAEEGAKGLYAGLSASLTRQATYGTARIGLHTAFTKELVDRNGGGKPPLWMSFISSFCSGAIASSIGNAAVSRSRSVPPAANAITTVGREPRHTPKNSTTFGWQQRASARTSRRMNSSNPCLATSVAGRATLSATGEPRRSVSEEPRHTPRYTSVCAPPASGGAAGS